LNLHAFAFSLKQSTLYSVVLVLQLEEKALITRPGSARGSIINPLCIPLVASLWQQPASRALWQELPDTAAPPGLIEPLSEPVNEPLNEPQCVTVTGSRSTAMMTVLLFTEQLAAFSLPLPCQRI